MLLVVVFVPQLPRRVLVPLVVFPIWIICGAPPLRWIVQGPPPVFALCAIQLALSVLALHLIVRSHGRWRLTAERLPRIEHYWRRTAGAVVVTLALASTTLVALILVSMVTSVEARTGGYLQLSRTGIEGRETVLKRGKTTVHLVATAHFAEPEFYQEIHARISPGALVLVEGVSDRDGRLREFSYDEVAQDFGLSTQSVFDELIGPAEPEPTVRDELVRPEPVRPRDKPRVVRADIDAAELSERAIEFVQSVGALYRSASLREAVAALMSLSQRFPNAEVSAVFAELIDQRNRHLLDVFDRLSPGYEAIYIPWGAMHMPGLAAAFTAREFTIESERQTPIAHYSTILEHRLQR